MNIINYLKQHKISVVLYGLVIMNMQAKIVEYANDAYVVQAPQELVDKTETVAQLMNFQTPYEVVVPTTAGIQINPWNKFVAYGINPLTKNPFILINPEWFTTLSPEQQQFLLARNFATFKEGLVPRNLTVIHYAYMGFSLLLVILLFFILRRTIFAYKKVWVSLVVAVVVVGLSEVLFLNSLYERLKMRYASKHASHINETTLEKTGNRQAAVEAFKSIDTVIKNELKNGELFWAPYENVFEQYADELKNHA